MSEEMKVLKVGDDEFEIVDEQARNNIANIEYKHFINRYFNSLSDENAFIFYVSSNGDDTADGTNLHPVKTIKRAMQLASSKYDDIRIHITSEGIYTADMLTFSANALHIYADVPNIEVNFRNGSFYSSHLYLYGYDESNPIKITCNNDRNLIYLDGGTVSAYYVDFDCNFRLNGAHGGAIGCIFHNLYLYGSNFVFEGGNNYFGNPVNLNEAVLLAVNSVVYLKSTIQFSLSENKAVKFISFNGGALLIGNSCVNKTGYVYSGDITINRTAMYYSDAALKSFEDMVSGNKTYGALISGSNTREHSVSAQTTAVTTNAYTDLLSFTIPAGTWLCIVTAFVNGGGDFYGNLRAQTNTNSFYESFHGVSGKNAFKNFVFYVTTGSDSTITVQGQYFSGVSIQLSAKYKRI